MAGRTAILYRSSVGHDLVVRRTVFQSVSSRYGEYGSMLAERQECSSLPTVSVGRENKLSEEVVSCTVPCAIMRMHGESSEFARYTEWSTLRIQNKRPPSVGRAVAGTAPVNCEMSLGAMYKRLNSSF